MVVQTVESGVFDTAPAMLFTQLVDHLLNALRAGSQLGAAPAFIRYLPIQVPYLALPKNIGSARVDFGTEPGNDLTPVLTNFMK
jgi:hypothetical protein